MPAKGSTQGLIWRLRCDGGPLDPAIAAAVASHARGENGVSRNAAASVPAAVPNAFDWGAAGIGAIVAILAVLLGLGVTRLIPRRRRAQLV